jgi:uncharacterized protein (TIGR00661 family)
MTQALAMQQMLRSAGHELVRAVVVTNTTRSIPSFFYRKINAPVTSVEGPGFIPDSGSKGIKPGLSIVSNLKKTPRLLEGMTELHAQVTESAPDLIINFYDVLTGLMSQRFRPGVPIVAVAHQYLFQHRDFSYPPGRYWDRWMFQAFTRATVLGSDLRLALSFYPLASYRNPRLTVVPPLIRRELLEQPLDRTDDFILVYLLNDGYAGEVIEWHDRHPHVPIHCFWDREEADEREAYDETLTFHQLDDEKFLSLMARSMGVATTAGFESICEAMYLAKPVFMVPVKGHYEQYCNAYDACRAGAGIRGASFDLNPLLRYREMDAPSPEPFRAWVERAPAMVLNAIESVVAEEAPKSRA